ncbi:MAG: sigma-70 family RNA polymerase sigma factor [Polyangiaceae bacterium]
MIQPPHDADDNLLITRIIARDEAALRVLHTRYAPLIFTIAARIVDRASAEEIAQDVFVTLWTKHEQFDAARGSLKNWLCQIARRQALNVRRKGKARDAQNHDGDEALTHVADDAEQPDETQWLAQRRHALRAAIDQLPTHERTALTLAFFDELSHEQIAATLKTPLGTTKTRIRVAMKRLAPALLALLGAVLLFLYWRKSERTQARTDRALQMVTASDVVPLHLVPPGSAIADHPQIHGSYRGRPGVDVGVLTATMLPALAAGNEYDAWLRQGEHWILLGTLQPREDGRALLVADDPALETAPDEVRVTSESHAGPAPSGSIVIAWPPTP